MSEANLESLRYPIGRYRLKETLSPKERTSRIERIALTPSKMQLLIQGLDDAQLDTPYRPEGWTVRQVVHHVVDSHLNSYLRFKWTLTEDSPSIKVYNEKAWAELPEARSGPLDLSLPLLSSLHTRWVAMLKAMKESDFRKKLIHPESGEMNLDQMLSLYAWHGDHHMAQIKNLTDQRGW